MGLRYAIKPLFSQLLQLMIRSILSMKKAETGCINGHLPSIKITKWKA